MAEPDLKIHRLSAEISFFDVDVKLRTSPVAYWKLLQNAAAAHARALSAATEQLREQGQTWMLSKMKLQVDRHLTLGETAHIETWPSTKLKGARAYRDYALKDGEGKVCATAASLWVIVDLATRRPQRIPDSIAALRTDPGHQIPAIEDAWLTPPEAPDQEKVFRAEWSDCDQNEHVNNVTILRWAIDAMPLAILESSELSTIEVHYRNELRINETVTVHTQQSGPQVRQSIRNESGTEIALIHSHWLVT